MKKIIYIIASITVLSMVSSCKNDFETDVKDIVVTQGEADFSKYVALGNSLTSGYRDGALYIDGQNESYPNIIANQMKLAGGGSFLQPLMNDNLGGIPMVNFPNKRILALENGTLAPVVASGLGTTTLANIYDKGPYQNMGVPGAKSYHLVASTYGNPAYLAQQKANPYFVRFASSVDTSVIADAVKQKPTFFSLWIGNNDVLSYATNGGMNSSVVGGNTVYTPAVVQTSTDASSYASNDISSPLVVAGSIKTMLEALKNSGATKGVIANIPDVSTIPFFTRIPYNGVHLTAQQATKINQELIGRLKLVLNLTGDSNRFQEVKEGMNPFIIVDNTLQDRSPVILAALTQYGMPMAQAQFIAQAFGKARHSKAGELILLTASSVLGKDALTNQAPTANSMMIYGASFPVPDQLSLTETEVNNISNAVTAYNTAIQSLANQYNLAFVDANAKMKALSASSGLQYDGVRYTASFVTGGAFSLDGVHLTGRGYAIIANEFLKAINTRYKSTLPLVNANNYSGVKFP